MEISTVKSDPEKGRAQGMVNALVLIGKSGVISGAEFDKIINTVDGFPPLSLDEEWDIETNSGWNRKHELHQLVDELQERDKNGGSDNSDTWNRIREEIDSDKFVKRD